MLLDISISSPERGTVGQKTLRELLKGLLELGNGEDLYGLLMDRIRF